MEGRDGTLPASPASMTCVDEAEPAPKPRVKHLLTGAELDGAAVKDLLELSRQMKIHRGAWSGALAGKTLAMIFAKPSTRTRVSFEVGMKELGGYTVVLNARDMQLGRGETIEDTGAVLSRYVAGVAVRTFAHAELEALAAASTVPVINMLTDSFHPCQALADLLTLAERFGSLEGVEVAYVGDGNNVLHSLLLLGTTVGVRFRVATPPGFEPDPAVVQAARRNGSEVVLTHSAEEAVAGAHAVYTDVWTSMGWEDERETRLKVFQPYQVTPQLMAAARPDAVFMHCLPAHRGEEVTAEVIDGPQSVVWDQAENRLHAQKALLLTLLG